MSYNTLSGHERFRDIIYRNAAQVTRRREMCRFPDYYCIIVIVLANYI